MKNGYNLWLDVLQWLSAVILCPNRIVARVNTSTKADCTIILTDFSLTDTHRHKKLFLLRGKSE